MLNKVEALIKDILALLQVIKLYTTEHPRFINLLEETYDALLQALAEKEEIILGIVGDELAFGKEIFFELSKTAGPIIAFLKKMGVEKISFHRGIQRDELIKFVSFLANAKPDAGGNIQESLNSLGVSNILVGKLSASTGGYEKSSTDYLALYQMFKDHVSNGVDGIMDSQRIDFVSLRSTISEISDSLSDNHNEMLKIMALKRYDLGTFAHIMNVSVLSMYFASRLGFSKSEILELGTAALFHDIGKLYISRKIIKKTDKLTDEEFSEIKSHVLLGPELLLKYVDVLGILPVIVSFEHHMRQDYKSYPKLAYPYTPHVASAIVSICDVYDALAQRRSYKADYAPNMIYGLMIRDKNTFFEPELVTRFFSIVGVWPVGTIVSLNEGRVGIVREENEADIFLPKVEIMHPPASRGMIDLLKNKEIDWIESFVNPLRQGKSFLNLV